MGVSWDMNEGSSPGLHAAQQHPLRDTRVSPALTRNGAVRLEVVQRGMLWAVGKGSRIGLSLHDDGKILRVTICD